SEEHTSELQSHLKLVCRLLLEKKIETSGSGEFELDDVTPGDYKLSLDPGSLPANYVTPVEAVSIHVSPVSTVIQDSPIRDLRSISGRVLLRVQDDLPASSALKQKREAPGR